MDADDYFSKITDLTDEEISEQYPQQIRSKLAFVYSIEPCVDVEYKLVRIGQYRRLRKSREINKSDKDNTNSHIGGYFGFGFIRYCAKYTLAEISEKGWLEGVTLEEDVAVFQRDSLVPPDEEFRKFPRQSSNGMVYTNEKGTPIFRFTFLGKQGENGELDSVINYVISDVHINTYLSFLLAFSSAMET